MKQSQSRFGFTLIELLVVIAIIAILAAILFSVFAQAREKARTASCLSNTKQLGLGVVMYVQDYDETFPYWSWWYSSEVGGCPRSDGNAVDAGCNQWGSFWFNAIYPYVKNAQVYACPSANDRSTILQNAVWGWTSNNTPALMEAHGFQSAMVNATVNYAYNQALAEGTIAGGSGTGAAALAALTLPAQTLTIADSDTGETNSLPVPNASDPKDPLHTYIISRVAWPNTISGCWGAAGLNCGAALNNSGIGEPSQFGTGGVQPLSYYTSQARHSGGDNLTFADGHSKWIRDVNITLDYQFGTWANQ